MKNLVGLIVIALLIPTAAIGKGECKAEKQKFCQQAEDIGACVTQHRADLSEDCKAQLEAREKNPAPTDNKQPNKQM